ncbi:Na+/H+ antiporter subunit E [Natranaerofaba carboxydovora]|uniref:Na+/H+ antiporter subunit E n=1 Tax=Natranaerofaba carboxydovora TaxID=2742683 RepID=UPI001F13F5D6|nr:Na+/H+ antiporter subunit E [Natranaerofaba carboxydovora]UMZ74585.1 Na(+)/H(+) antiporter subunit E1 [Natranaerofaba carboxydovora]
MENYKIKDFFGFLTITILLLGFWFMLAPYFDFYNVFLGILFSASLTYIWRKNLFKSKKKTKFGFKQIFLFAFYIFSLILNIVKANINVAKIVLSPKMPIEPGIVVVKSILQNDLSKVFYSNSITLTPGTLTVDSDGDKLIIHALTKENAYGVSDWYMENLMKNIEEGEPK